VALPEDGFACTAEEQRCRFCVYRSYCDRGTAGSLEEAPPLEDAGAPGDWDLAQIAEIEF